MTINLQTPEGVQKFEDAFAERLAMLFEDAASRGVPATSVYGCAFLAACTFGSRHGVTIAQQAAELRALAVLLEHSDNGPQRGVPH